MGGKTHQETGRDTFVLERINDTWLAVWRQLGDQMNSWRSVHRERSSIFSTQSESSPFLNDMRDVMGHVLDFGLEHFLKGDQPSFAMNAGTSPGRFGQRAQHQSHLSTHPFHEGKLGFEVVVVVAENCSEPALVVADQEGLFLGDDPLHAVAPGLFAVDQMAYDLEGAPLSGHGPCLELRNAHVGDGPSQPDRAIEIRVNLFAKT